MQQPQQPRYFLFFFFFLRLCPSRFIFSAYVLNISNDNNVYHADLYRGSVNLHLTSLNRQRMREIDWASAITCVCPSGGVMYICENRLSCPRKVKSVLTSTLCWSAEPLKVALKVKMISAALHIIINITYLEWISVFWTCSWMNGLRPTQRRSLTRHRVAQQWNCTELTDSPSRTRRLNINRKVSCQSDSRIRTNCYIYIYIYIYANNRTNDLIVRFMFCYVDRYFVILFRLLHFLFQRD